MNVKIGIEGFFKYFDMVSIGIVWSGGLLDGLEISRRLETSFKQLKMDLMDKWKVGMMEK